MRAVVYEEFGGPIDVREVPDPEPARAGVVIRVRATGLCRSDWHGWMGHDADIELPHVPGHELVGDVVAAGPDVTTWRTGERVTVPFVCACGTCASCVKGAQQVCERQTQPGFTHWGSFAEYVAIDHADVNLVAVPETLADPAAAGLGCRFATAFRAVTGQAAVRPGEWVAVYGCGGVGLSAVLVAVAGGARVVAIDVSDAALRMAATFGASACVRADDDVVRAVVAATGGGAHVSLDALGDPTTCAASVRSLRRQGRHVQVGLLPGAVPLPMDRVIAWELSVLGSHGMAAHDYPAMLAMVESRGTPLESLVTKTIGLPEAPAALATMDSATGPGVTVITP